MATVAEHDCTCGRQANNRVTLAQAAKDSDTSKESILDRILNPDEKAFVEVASFQSSI